MSLKAKATSNNKSMPGQEPVEAGTYAARIVQIIDLGLQAQPAWQGNEKPPTQEIMLTYELLDEFMIDEKGNEDESKPRWVSERFALRALSSDLAKSTKRYKALAPEGDGDFAELVGEPCMVTLGVVTSKKTGKQFNSVMNVSAMRSKDAAKAPELKNDPRVFSLDDADVETFKKLPEWLQETIKGNLEYKGSLLEKKLNGEAVSSSQEDSHEDLPY